MARETDPRSRSASHTTKNPQARSDLRVHEGWRWRESNPRPSASTQDFSGRSLLVAFLSPSTRTDSVADRLSHCKCPALTP